MRAEAEFGITDMAMNNSRYHGDESLLVRFYTHPRKNLTKSEEENRPIFEDTTYIEIMQPGNKDSIIQRPATARDKQRFAQHFQRFEARVSDDQVEGTLLSEWPQVTRAQVEELRFLNIRTVEQLAVVSDSNAQNIMGIQMLKSKAQKYLEHADKEATAERFAELEAKYEALLAAQSEEKPKRTRRTKEQIAADEAAED
jgi:hypothetical protein